MSVVGELHMHGYAVLASCIRSTKTFQNAPTKVMEEYRIAQNFGG